MDKPEVSGDQPLQEPLYQQVPERGKSMVGQIVLYNLRQDEYDDDLRSNGATQLPAIVVQDFNHGMSPPYPLNLRIFTDSDESPAWKTSVPLYDGRMAFGGFWEFKK